MAGDRWYPVSDHALEVLRIRDVGGGDTPLVGAYSRFGWNHPGPLLFWVLAPPYRVLGEVGLLVGAAALNAAALVGTLLVARRRGGTALVVFVAAGCAVLCHAIGPELLIDPWNAWVPVIPFLLYALLAWSVAERDWPTLPWLVGVGSFVVQSHFGYTPLVAGLGLAAAGLAAWTHVPIAGRPRSVTRRDLAVTAGVAIVLWLPPLLQQLTGSPGNLGELVGVARDPDEDVAGWAAGFGLMGRELELFGPLFTGEDRGFLGIVHPASTLAAISLVVTTGLAGAWASHRGCKGAGRLALIGVVSAGLGVVAASRINGLVVPYLLRWSWVIATLLWVSLLWSVWSILRRTPVAVGLVAGVAVVAVAFVATTAWSAVSIATPTATASTVVEHLTPSTARHLSRDKQYLVTWVERQYLTGIGPGMVLELTNRGYTVGVQKRVAHRFSDRRISSRSEVDGVVTIVDGASELGWAPPAGARLIARYQPSTEPDRARRRLLRTRVDAVIANACGEAADSFDRCALLAASRDRVAVAALDELADIDQRGDPYVVYLSSKSQSKSSMR